MHAKACLVHACLADHSMDIGIGNRITLNTKVTNEDLAGKIRNVENKLHQGKLVLLGEEGQLLKPGPFGGQILRLMLHMGLHQLML